MGRGGGDWKQGQIEQARASIYISCISQTFSIFQSATISDKTYLIVRACDISQNFCMIDNLSNPIFGMITLARTRSMLPGSIYGLFKIEKIEFVDFVDELHPTSKEK